MTHAARRTGVRLATSTKRLCGGASLLRIHDYMPCRLRKLVISLDDGVVLLDLNENDSMVIT